VNIGANVVSPRQRFFEPLAAKNLFQSRRIITCFMGVAMMPWKLAGHHKTFIFGWLGGYAAVLVRWRAS